jgi:hypothetical protein
VIEFSKVTAGIGSKDFAGIIVSCAIACFTGCSANTKNPTPAAVGGTDQSLMSRPSIRETPSIVTVHSSPSSSQSILSTKVSIRAEPSTESGKLIDCSKSEDKRSLSIRETPVGGCEVLYRKTGQTASIANAEHALSVCERVVANVKANLERVGFTCVAK